MTLHLIFDLDGTLVDSSSICCTILMSMLRERQSDHAIDFDDARQYMSRGGEQMVSALLGSACGDPKAELAEFRSRYSKTMTPVSALFPYVDTGLKALHASGYSLSICSNKPQALCEQVLTDTGLAPLFSEVVGGGNGFRPKPDTDLLDEVLRRLDIEPGNSIYIGDSELDYQVAQAVGMPFFFMTYGYAVEKWVPEDSLTFDTFEALTGSLLGVAQRDNAA